MKYRSAQYLFWKIGLKHIKAFLWERGLAEEIPKMETKVPVEIRLASINDFTRYRSLMSEASKRLSIGDLCFAAIHKGSIAGYVWASLKRRVYIPEFEIELVFNNGEAYLYDGYMFPDFARRGILKKILEEELHYLKSLNVKRANAITLTTNEPPQRALIAVGFRAVKIVKLIKIFKYRKLEEQTLETIASVSRDKMQSTGVFSQSHLSERTR